MPEDPSSISDHPKHMSLNPTPRQKILNMHEHHMPVQSGASRSYLYNHQSKCTTFYTPSSSGFDTVSAISRPFTWHTWSTSLQMFSQIYRISIKSAKERETVVFACLRSGVKSFSSSCITQY